MEASENNLQSVLEGRWQWKSNQDPWSQSEEPQWESYSLADNLLLEEAYYDKQKKVDFSNHIVSIEQMLQINKGDKTLQRPVRRMDWMEDVEMNSRSERYYETESPKPINKVFGDLHDFVNFFSKRTPEIWDFVQLFKEIEESDDIERLNKQICPEIRKCIIKEFHKLDPPKPSDKPLSAIQKMLEMKKKKNQEVLFLSFQNIFTNFDEFYAQVLRAYTMNTFLYQNLNRYLREEAWAEINDLLSYAFCLCKAFFSFKSATNSQNPQGATAQKSAEMTLYRGTALSAKALEHFQKSKVQRFSWHSITSTSKNKIIAEKFMTLSNDTDKKHSVMFIIQVPMIDSADLEYVNYLDIKEYSVIPSEDEVILPPGSVFDLEEVTKDKNGTIIIQVQLKNNVKSLAYGGLIMPGTLQNEMITDGKAKKMTLICLEGEELFDTMKSISGNRLIEEVEFCLCNFDDNLFEEVIGVLATLEKIDLVQFVSCEYQDEKKMRNVIPQRLKELNVSKLKILEMIEFDRFLHKKGDNYKYWTSLKSLEISFGNFRDFEKNDLCFKGLQHLNQLVSLNIDFEGYSLITDDKLESLSKEGLKYLCQLTSLGLNFNHFSHLTDEGIKFLCFEGLQHLTRLTLLNLDFSSCPKITDETVNNLSSQVLKHLSQLTSLNLNFWNNGNITDEGINSLCAQGLRHLAQLTSLNLNFKHCFRVTEKGAKRLGSQVLQYFAQLESLSLNPSWFHQIIDQGVNSLFQELQRPLQIKSLKLSFKDYMIITDEEVKSFCSQVLQHLTQLTTLDLNFSWSEKITAEGVFILSSQGIRHLTQLTSLVLDFSSSNQITDEGVNYLCRQGLQSLPRLASLNLRLTHCNRITDEGMNILCSQGLQYLTQLTDLNLDFTYCKTITDEGVNNLYSEGVRYLTQLKSLNLNFKNCEHIKNEGVNRQRSQGLQNLFKLSSLTLPSKLQMVSVKSQDHHSQEILTATSSAVIACQRVSNDSNHTSQNITSSPENCSKELGALLIQNYLGNKDSLPESNAGGDLEKKSKTLSSLQQRESLDLNFSQFSQITDEEVNILCSHGLKTLTQLVSLNLDFSKCGKITNEGMTILYSQGLEPLAQLTSLNLNLSYCTQITDDGMNNIFPKKLENLTRLTSLNLNFSCCGQITNEGVNILCSQGLQYLTHLKSLHLNFENCNKITDEGVSILCCQGLQHLTRLASLNLNFSCCEQLTDEGVRYLGSQGLRFLAELASFHLDLGLCKAVTDEGINFLCTQALKNLTQLTSLGLYFHGVLEITKLYSQGLQCLAQLVSLHLDFSLNPNKINDEGTNILCFQGFQRLIQLKSLDIDFSWHRKRIDEEIEIFSSQGLQYLTHLTSLTLNFTSCLSLTDKGIKSLCLSGLRHLTELTSLNLDFFSCKQITSDGVNILCSQALKYLTRLTLLNLNFLCCLELTDKGLNSLSSEGIKYLPHLTLLKVDFRGCNRISLFAKSNINRILRYFGFRNVDHSIFDQTHSFKSLIWTENRIRLKKRFRNYY